ncbi:hypothetical protein M409DRAFT_19116 [Zasmidium cellare ATCC 36951]|uniref:Apple domain-containing protein n=1 Tax=Zasmidium cellare ATCC 36951 TaxID=1080233 RepID=A0A6A6CVT0_ZASCE|nr:uncharacterized protein M409DRAFT_19116 [Zasmidium cellare ATCC 36951]KAF2171145.1 hypothetical protein M409DRAFT_19116 [Zasmidium cellare ATCC 36951]
MSLEIPRRHSTPGHSFAMAALVPLLLHFGLANAQSSNLPGVPNPVATSNNAGNANNAGITPSVPSGCPSVVTLTVLPSDYSGSLISLASSLWPSLPTFSVPGLPSLPPISIPDLSITIPPLTGSSRLPLPTINPSGTLDLPTLSLPVSALLPTVPLPSGTPVSYTCPEADGKLIIQNLLPFVVDCGATATGTVYTSVPAVDTFNDCFSQCDRSGTDQGAKYCTGFYYEGATDGDGAGTCYLQNSVSQGFSSAQGSSNRVAAVRLLNYLVGGNNPLPPLLGDLPISPQLPGAISSLLSEIGTILPTNLPLTTQLPDAISSLLGGATSGTPNGISSLLNDLTSGLSLPTNLPLTTEVPNAISSILGGVSSGLPAGVSSLLNDLTSGISVPTNLPITTDLPNAVSSILSEINNLPTDVPASSLLGDLSSILGGPSGVLSSLVGDITGALPTPSPNLPISSLINDLSSALNPLLVNPTQGIPGAVSSLLGSQGLPSVISSILNPSNGGALSSLLNPSSDGGALSSLLNDLTAIPSITPLVTLPTNILPSGSLPSLTNLLPTSLPSGAFPSISIPSGSLPSLSLPSGIVVPSISIPGGSLPSFSNLLPTSLPSGIIPPINGPSPGTNLISTTDANGLPTLISITPTVVVPSITVSLPTDLSLTGSLTNLVPTTGLGGITTLISVPTDLSLTVPPLSLSVSSISIPSVGIPSVPIPSASIPIVSIPSVSPPPISISVSSISVPSGILPTNILPSGSGGNPLSSLLPSTNILPSLTLPGGGGGSSSNALIPTATAFPIFGCPGDTGLAYVSPSGQAFSIVCNTDVVGYQISTALQPDLESCVNSCGGVQGCTTVAYQSSTGICSYKSQNGQSIAATTDFSAAIAIDLSCPNGNGVTYLDAYGSNYQILCNYTFPSRTEISPPVSTGRLVDERSLALEKRAPSDASFLPCSIRCSLFSGCIAVTEENDVCLYISNLGPAGEGSNIADTVALVAKRIITVNGNGAPVTSTSAAASVPTVATSRSATVYNPPASTPNLGLSSVLGGITTLPTVSLPAVPLPTVSGSLGLGLSASLAVSGSVGVSGSISVPPISVPPLLPTNSVTCGPGLLGIGACSSPTPTPTVVATSECTPQPGLLGVGAVDCSTSTTSSSVSRTQITITVPVSTFITTSTVTSCSTNFLNQVVCPTVNVIQTLVGTRTTVTSSFITITSSTLATSTSSSSTRSSSSARSSTSSVPAICVGPLCII